ncbi:MAG: hypothetical protein IJJ25_09135 [Lachnospiraceae bacterium]|nr:hypothetical protein [Lachnospiraceae bacterium]
MREIADNFLYACEEKSVFPWEYYYIKYSSFRPGSYGKFCNDKMAEEPYLSVVMQTRSQLSQNAYIPYLKEADDKHLSRDSLGQRLVYGDSYIICRNDCFLVIDNATEEEIETIAFRQNEQGIDTEDRIEVLKKYIDRINDKDMTNDV